MLLEDIEFELKLDELKIEEKKGLKDSVECVFAIYGNDEFVKKEVLESQREKYRKIAIMVAENSPLNLACKIKHCGDKAVAIIKNLSDKTSNPIIITLDDWLVKSYNERYEILDCNVGDSGHQLASFKINNLYFASELTATAEEYRSKIILYTSDCYNNLLDILRVIYPCKDFIFLRELKDESSDQYGFNYEEFDHFRYEDREWIDDLLRCDNEIDSKEIDSETPIKSYPAKARRLDQDEASTELG